MKTKIIIENIFLTPKIAHALIGALVAAGLLELAKMGFTWYLSSYDTYELLYGAFATVPIFFLWVYWAWFIVLLGGEVAYAFSAPHYRRTGTRLDGLTHTVHWLGYLYKEQLKGQGLTLEALIKKDTLAYEVKPEVIIQYFLDAKLVTLSENSTYVLCQSLETLTFDEVRSLVPWRLPKYDATQLLSDNEPYLLLIKNSQSSIAQSLHVPMAKLYL